MHPRLRARTAGSLAATILVAVGAHACAGRSQLHEGSRAATGGSGTGGSGTGGSGTGGSEPGGAGGTGAGATGGAGAAGGAGGSDLDTVLAACATAASCAPDMPNDGLGWPLFTPSACVDGFARLGRVYQGPGTLPDPDLAARLLACAADVSDCASFRSCFGGDWIGLSRCREEAHCQGNALSHWTGGVTFDCGTLGASCVDLWSNALRACCNAEPCAQPTQVGCSGTMATFCGGWGEHVSFDCGASGQICVDGADAWEPCAGTGAACTADTPVSCAGSVASYCSAGHVAELDCGDLFSSTACAAGAGAYEPCRPAGVACWPLDDLGHCDGNALVMCVDGDYRPVDCTVLGFDLCELPPAGYARCAFAE